MRPAPGKQRKRDRPVVGLLGCMAERLQSELLEKSVVDVVVVRGEWCVGAGVDGVCVCVCGGNGSE